jgi:hypothetical protein
MTIDLGYHTSSAPLGGYCYYSAPAGPSSSLVLFRTDLYHKDVKAIEECRILPSWFTQRHACALDCIYPRRLIFNSTDEELEQMCLLGALCRSGE